MKTSNKSYYTSLSPEVITQLANVNRRLVERHKKQALYQGIMDVKSERKAKDLALRPLLLNVGMAISILFAIIAINWKSYDDGEIVDLGKVEADLNEIIEIPASSQELPPPPKQEVFKIEEVKDTEIIEEIKINLDVEVTENEALEEIEFTPVVEEEEQVEEIFVIVEQEPVPVGGFETFYAYLAEELVYPPRAARFGVSGSVFVQFIIEKDGRITDAKIVRGIGMGCDEEALRVINKAPAWQPGKQRGVTVRVKKIIPVRFVLANED